MDMTCMPSYFDPLSQFVEELHKLIFNGSVDLISIKSSKVRLHTKSLDTTGDLNFPLCLHQWLQWLKKSLPEQEACKYLQLPETATVFEFLLCEDITQKHLNSLFKLNNIEDNILKIHKICLFDHKVHLFFDRVCPIPKIVSYVTSQNSKFFTSPIVNSKLVLHEPLREKELSDISLSDLRMILLEDFTIKLIKALHDPNKEQQQIKWSQKSSEKDNTTMVCGPVLNHEGFKDTQTSADQLLVKRSNDMRLIAEHRYRMKVDASSDWREYFKKIGRAAITVHMLQQKPHKEVKISIHDISTTHKGPEFIFYNCARLGALLKQYDRKVEEGIYRELPPIEEVNFSLLNQPEEWQLFYVYVVQFPTVIKSCFSVNTRTDMSEVLPQNLVIYLSNLARTFSTYYGRIKILTDPREHMFPALYARIYLLKTLQIVFHSALDFLDIEPIHQM